MQNPKDNVKSDCIALRYADLFPMIKLTKVDVGHAVLPGKYRDWLR